jgi:hypothetical protein
VLAEAAQKLSTAQDDVRVRDVIEREDLEPILREMPWTELLDALEVPADNAARRALEQGNLRQLLQDRDSSNEEALQYLTRLDAELAKLKVHHVTASEAEWFWPVIRVGIAVAAASFVGAPLAVAAVPGAVIDEIAKAIITTSVAAIAAEIVVASEQNRSSRKTTAPTLQNAVQGFESAADCFLASLASTPGDDGSTLQISQAIAKLRLMWACYAIRAQILRNSFGSVELASALHALLTGIEAGVPHTRLIASINQTKMLIYALEE